MFGLLSGLGQWCFQKRRHAAVVIGLDNAGKTTLLERMKQLFDPLYRPGALIVPTVGLNLARLDVGRGQVELFDLGGQTSLRGIWDKYWADCQALVFVVDASDPVRFAEARTVLTDVIQRKRDAPIALVANKSDLATTESARAYFAACMSERVLFFPVSAITGDGVKGLVHWIAECGL